MKVNASVKEIERMFRVCDMSISAHATLSSKNTVLSNLLDFSALLLSVLTLTLTFANSNTLEQNSNYWGTVFLILPWVGVIVFVFTITQLKFDFKGKAASHHQAAKSLSSVKAELKLLKNESLETQEAEFPLVQQHYNLVMGSIIPLSDSTFLKLKAKHLQKVRISKHLDNKPSSNIFILKLKFWLKDNFSNDEKNSND